MSKLQRSAKILFLLKIAKILFLHSSEVWTIFNVGANSFAQFKAGSFLFCVEDRVKSGCAHSFIEFEYAVPMGLMILGTALVINILSRPGHGILE